ncbi:MAG: hypothetical protein AB7T22_16710 [Calditrichaceae bacterium]
MFFELGIFGSLISALLSIFMVSFLYHILNKTHLYSQAIRNSNSSAKEDNRHVLFLKLLLFILTILIIAKIITVVIFPMEISTGDFKPDLNMMTIALYTGSIILLFVTIFLAFVVLYYFRIKVDHKISFLKKSINILKYFLIFDIAYSIFFIVSTDYYVLLNETAQQIHDYNALQFWPYKIEIAAVLFGLVFLYSLLYHRFQKRRTLLNFRIYGVFLVLSLLLSIYLMLIYTASMVGPARSFIELFGFRSGFTGLLWISIFLAGVSSQLFSLLLLSIKKTVINLQLNMNYILQLNRVAFISTIGISVLALFPVVLEMIYRY